MSVIKLGQLLENKYSLVSSANVPPPDQIINQVKRDILDAYKNYVGSQAKESILSDLAQMGEQFSKELVTIMEDLVANLDYYTPVQLFNRVNKVLGLINEMKNDPKRVTMNWIHDSQSGSSEAKRNNRERVKSKFTTYVGRISGILEKVAKILNKFMPKEVPLAGGLVGPERMELSKEKILMFMRTPAAQKYGLDNIDVMTKLLSYPELKFKITTLINAIDRGHSPVDGPEIMTEVGHLMELFNQKVTNESFMESGSIPAAEPEIEDKQQPKLAHNIISNSSNKWLNQLIKRYNHENF